LFITTYALKINAPAFNIFQSRHIGNPKTL